MHERLHNEMINIFFLEHIKQMNWNQMDYVFTIFISVFWIYNFCIIFYLHYPVPGFHIFSGNIYHYIKKAKNIIFHRRFSILLLQNRIDIMHIDIPNLEINRLICGSLWKKKHNLYILQYNIYMSFTSDYSFPRYVAELLPIRC